MSFTLTRRAALWGVAAGGAALSSCATSVLVPQGAYTANDAFSVTLQRPWSDLTNYLMPRPPGVRMLSIDGPMLNRLYLATLEPGGSLVRPVDRDTPRPTYRADMGDTEIVEFITDCVAVEFQSPESSALRPQNLGSLPGVRFDLLTRTQAGLDIGGTALAARGADDKLNLMLYLAPREHYYARLLPDVEAAFTSAALA